MLVYCKKSCRVCGGGGGGSSKWQFNRLPHLKYEGHCIIFISVSLMQSVLCNRCHHTVLKNIKVNYTAKIAVFYLHFTLRSKTGQEIFLFFHIFSGNIKPVYQSFVDLFGYASNLVLISINFSN